MAELLSRSVQALQETLRSKSPHRGSQAAQIAEDLYTFTIERITDTELAYCSSVLFNTESGILKFMKDAAGMEEFAGCKEKLLDLLNGYVQMLGEKVIRYAPDIKDVCFALFTREKSSKVKNSTFPPLIAVLELCVGTPTAKLLDVAKMSEKYFQACLQPTKHTSTVRGCIFHILGTLCEVYPEQLVPYSDRLVDIYVKALKAETNSKKPEMPVIGGVLRGLASYLTNFSHSVAEGSAYAQDIFKYMYMVIDSQIVHTRYEVPRAGLLLLAKHAAQFKEYLARNHEQLYEYLVTWCSHHNRETREVAIKAFDAFLQQVAIHITENASKDRQSNEYIFRDFIMRFRKIMDCQSSGHKELAMAIQGYGYFAAPCKLFMKPEDIQFMFGELVQRSEQLFFSTNETSDGRLFQLPTFLLALASIVKEIDELSESSLACLEKLAILLFECYPYIPPVNRKATYSSLLRLIVGVSNDMAVLKAFLSRVVYQGLIRTCSHPVVIGVGDGSAVMAVEDVAREKMASYKDYIDLWSYLMDPSEIKGLTFQLYGTEQVRIIQQLVYDEFIRSVLRIVNKLDFALVSASAALPATPKEDAKPPDETTPTSDPVAGIQPSVPRDFQVFINLVDLCRDLLTDVHQEFFRSWVYTFGHEVIVYSSKHPVISGFYKLLSTCLIVCKKLDFFKGINDTSAMETEAADRCVCFVLVKKFLKEVLVRMKQYKGELLASCLQLLLSLPIELVTEEIGSLVPAVQVTLKLGLSYLPLANAGLDALEAWTSQLPPGLLQPYLQQILPNMDAYLRTQGTTMAEENGGSIVRPPSLRGARLAVKLLAKWKEGIEGVESPQGKLIQRIVHFLGILGGQVNTCLVKSESAAAYAARAVAWDSKRKLEFALPFQDMKPSIYLDPFLPRVCELAVSSSDRQSKVAACELLHAVVLFMIGKSAQPLHAQKNPMNKLYKKVFPYLLQLACDVERVAEQLFRPFVFQIIHWFTKNTQYESPDTIVLLESILDGIVSPTDTALRDFCALCIKEFLHWSIKQTTTTQQESSRINTKSLLKRLYSLSSHPSASKRLGAALAFNSIYTVFREEDSLVDMFVMEMLIVNVNSLKLAHKDEKSLGTQEQSGLVLDHLARIMKVKASLLIKPPSKSRRVPKGLKTAEMQNLVNWLLLQCGSPETECRDQCIKLFTQLTSVLPKTPNVRTWIRRTIESEGGSFFITRFEKGGHGLNVIQKQPILTGVNFTLADCVGWMEGLAAALDCYYWVFREQFITPSEVFQCSLQETGRSSCLFNSLQFFLERLALGGIEAAAACFDSSATLVHTPSESEEYSRAKCDLILRLFRFLSGMLNVHPKEAVSCVPRSFWSSGLFQLVVSCTVHPQTIGFNVGDVATMERLPKEMLVILTAMATHLQTEKELWNILMNQIISEIASGSAWDLISKLPLVIGGNKRSTNIPPHLDTVVKGHILLQKAHLLSPALAKTGAEEGAVVQKLLDSVLSSVNCLVKTSHLEEGTVSPSDELAAAQLLELALEIGVPCAVLLEFLLHQTDNEGNVGFLLYQTFSQTLNSYLVTDRKIISLMLQSTCKAAESVSGILGGLLDCVAKDKVLKRQYGSQLCSAILSQWNLMSSWWTGGNNEHQLAAANLLKRVLILEPKALILATPAEQEPVVSMYVALLEDKAPLSFKSKVMELLHYFAALPEGPVQRLKGALTKMVAYQFPLKSSELVPGTPHYIDYISVLDKLLNAMVASGCLVLLDVLMSILCREQRHAHEDHIQNSLVLLAKKFSASIAKSAIELAYAIFVNERDYPAEARRAAAERVCLPLMRQCSEGALKDFFAEHICQIMSMVDEKLVKNTLESQLVSKLCSFQFLEVLFSRLSLALVGSMDSKINQQYCKGDPKTGKELTQAVTKAGHEAKSEDLHGDKTYYELRRQYHCAAYNMLLAVITCTQNKLQFYTGFLFKEEPSKGQFLWENLIDLDREYHFEAELDVPIDRKNQMTSIRDEVRAMSTKDSSPTAASPPFPRRYLSSQYLADSSLGADISQYDFSTGTQAYPAVNIAPSVDAKETPFLLSEEKVEQDALNTHECMLPLMKLLDHLDHNKINPEVPKGTAPTEMPSWMAAVHKKMTEGRTHRNVRLFITRLIVNRPKVFQPYAKFWLPILAQLILSGEHGGEGLHYFVIDVIVTMLSWATTAILEDRQLASSLLEYVMQHANHENRSVFRNNLEVIKSLTECWKEKLQPPTKVIYDHFSATGENSKTANRTGIQLLAIVVANQMLPYNSATAKGVDEHKFYTAFCALMSHKYKEVHAAAAEVLGMVLAFKEEKKDDSIGLLQVLVSDYLTNLMDTRVEDKALICLQKIQLNYPKLTERFVEKLIFLLPMFQGVFRTTCLEVLLSQADVRPQFYLELRDKGFRDMLSHRDEPTQLACLAIVQKMLRNLSDEQMTELLPLINAFGSHSCLECRVGMYDILIWIYNHYFSPEDGEGMDTGGSNNKELLAIVRDQLLQGLADDAESIRLKMFDFWNQESRLASDTLGRLTQLLAVLYSTSTERYFLHNSTNLLLELTSRSPDFTRSIFDLPLSECKFQDKNIDLSWQQRHLQMTPLFAATLASQAGATLQDEVAMEQAEGGVRATQQVGPAFTPTQEGGGYTWMAPSAQSQDVSFTMGSLGGGTTQEPSETQQSSLLFRMPKNPLRKTVRTVEEGFGQSTLKARDSVPTDPQEAQQAEMLKLKKRFIRDRSITSAFFAKAEAKKKIVREEHRQRQKAARDSKVVMYRKYREGELPDIQIKHAEIIRPFQALAQKDTSLARMLFASLYEAIFKQLESLVTERDAEAIVTAVCDGLNAVLKSSTQFYPPLIGSLEDVCFSVKQLTVDCSAAATASLTSKQEPIGIMLLEKQISSSPGDAEAPSAKRAKGNAPSAATVTWVELARLYKSLGDFDVLHGIFSSHVGTKGITKDALEAEERGDFVEAVRQYKDAVGCDSWSDGPPMQVEEDLWEDSLLQCYNSLTEWSDLEKAAIVNIDDSDPPRLDKIWEDAYYLEHNLPHIMRAKLKLACGGVKDEQFNAFLDKALDSPEHRGLLHSRYSTELTLYYILKDDLDKAKYFAGNCVQSFLQEWPNLSMLLEKSRAAHLKQLQSLSEMREYLDFMSTSKNFESTGPVEKLLGRWRSTFPHPKLDPISVWDDIVTNRCMMLRKMMQRFQESATGVAASSADRMDVDGAVDSVSVTRLHQLFSREYIQLYLKIASTATGQSNYAVAKRYLQLTEKAASEHFAHDPSLKMQWIHGVTDMRIQHSLQDPSPTKLEPNIALLEQLDSYGKGSLDSTNNSLACHHWLLEGTVYDIMANAFMEDGSLLLSTLSDQKMKQLNTLIGQPAASRPKPEEVAHRLFIKALSSLKGGVKAGTEHHKASQDCSSMVKALVAMAKFCDAALRGKEEDADVRLDTKQFPSVVVSYSLKAMQYQSQSATQQFPRLLQIVELYPDSLDAFLKKAPDVPNWMFIGWISQMVALMDKPAGLAVHNILLSIACDYPQALVYPFKISSSDFKFGSSQTDRTNQEAVEQVKRKLENAVINDFIGALEQLSSPELVWKDAVDNELKPLMDLSVGSRDEAKLKEVWQQIYSHLFDHKSWEGSQDGSLYGTPSAPSMMVGARKKKFAQDYVKQVDEKFGRDGSKLLKMKLSDFIKLSGEVNDAMRSSLLKTTGDSLLKNYSPWLHNFDSTCTSWSIEVPGQYDGKSKPLPEYHVKIAGFDEKVLVMSSIRKPKRITIRGDDEKEYKFLVKGGEDLRLDQRIEQLVDIMNGILFEDAACSQRGLSLKTYSVIPMTHRVGLIGWVENTIPLKDFLENALTESEKNHYTNGARWHNGWLGKFNAETNKAYKEMYRKAKRTEVEKEYRKKATSVPQDLLRRAFMNLAVSPEAFLALRSHFISTYASLSICHYVMGIGDRHLSNYMVDLESGGVVGIDFGHAFGTATQFLPYPELMPFRLTPQITNLLLPHLHGSGQLRNCMVHTMRALRASHNLILNTMDVFVKEPSLEWKSNSRKQAKDQKLSDDDLSQLDAAWYPKEKVQQAKKKLVGGNPAYIMMFDLEKGHSRTPEYPSLKAILMGDPVYNKRAKVGERCGSVEEQVDCLIDHATDPNILGRTWVGWEPWV